jgi:hypothetical protein
MRTVFQKILTTWSVPLALCLATAPTAGCIEGLADGVSGGGSGGNSGGDDGASAACGDVEDQLAGDWITEGDTASSYAYNTLNFATGSMTGEVIQYAGGYAQSTPFQWRLEGNCDEVHYDYGSGWLDDFSRIHELTASKLDLEATDGSYYGQRTRYDRLGYGGSGSGGDDGGMESDTCQQACDENFSDCSLGEVCWNTSQGMICVSEGCVACFEAGLSCTQNSLTCEFQYCE